MGLAAMNGGGHDCPGVWVDDDGWDDELG